MKPEKLNTLILIKTGFDIRERSRKAPIIEARTMFIALCSKFTLCNNQEIADYLGMREGNIRHHQRRHYNNIRYSFSYRFNYNELEKIIKDKF